jgi:hypothetical protein
MEFQEIPAPCSAQQLRKVAQRCERLRFFYFPYFGLIGHAGYLHYGFLASGIDSRGYFCAYTLLWPIFGDIEVVRG